MNDQKPFHHDLAGLVRFQIDDDALGKLPWKDFGNGVRVAKLAREGQTGLVVYDIAADARSEAFQAHKHVGGEAYLVLRGAIEDASGRYGEGEIVWMPVDSTHTPRGVGRTVVLVLWPGGIAAA